MLSGRAGGAGSYRCCVYSAHSSISVVYNGVLLCIFEPLASELMVMKRKCKCAYVNAGWRARMMITTFTTKTSQRENCKIHFICTELLNYALENDGILNEFI